MAALHLHFPGWILRLYVDHHSLDPATMDQLMDLASDPAMDLCIGLKQEGLELSARNGMLWRFLPLLDQFVDVSNSFDKVFCYLCKNKAIEDECSSQVSNISENFFKPLS